MRTAAAPLVCAFTMMCSTAPLFHLVVRCACVGGRGDDPDDVAKMPFDGWSFATWLELTEVCVPDMQPSHLGLSILRANHGDAIHTTTNTDRSQHKVKSKWCIQAFGEKLTSISRSYSTPIFSLNPLLFRPSSIFHRQSARDNPTRTSWQSPSGLVGRCQSPPPLFSSSCFSEGGSFRMPFWMRTAVETKFPFSKYQTFYQHTPR